MVESTGYRGYGVVRQYRALSRPAGYRTVGLERNQRKAMHTVRRIGHVDMRLEAHGAMLGWLRIPANMARALAVVLLAAVMVFGISLVEPKTAQSATPKHTVTYSVQQGDTLWGYAEKVTPRGKDIRQTVDEIVELNDLQSTSLVPGQSIVVPVDQ